MPITITKTNALKNERQRLAREIRALADRQATWSDADRKQWPEINAQYDRVQESLAVAERAAGVDGSSPFTPAEMLEDRNGRANALGLDGFSGFDGQAEHRGPLSPGEVRILNPRQSFRDALGIESSGLRLDRALRGIVSGRWDGAEAELRTMQEGGGAAGGYLVGPELAGYLIDLARSKSVCLRAGAGTIPMNSAELEIPTLTSDVTAEWVGETGAITATDAAFGAHVLKARTLACLSSVSIELAEDTNIGAIVQDSMAKAMALKLDYAALRGIGAANEPMGLRYAPAVNERAAVGLPSYDEFSQAVEAVWSANGEPNAAIFSPRTAGYLDRLKNGEGEPAMAPQSWRDLQYKLVSNQIPENLGVGTDESECYVGDFRQLQFGIRTSVRIEVFRGGSAGGLDAVSRKLIWIRAYLRADVHIARETHFTRLLGVTD